MNAFDGLAFGLLACGVCSLPISLLMGRFIHAGKGGDDDQ